MKIHACVVTRLRQAESIGGIELDPAEHSRRFGMDLLSAVGAVRAMYIKPGISIILSSDSAFEDLLAEIYYNGGLAMIVRKDVNTGEYLAEYLPRDKENDRFVGAVPLDALMDAIEQAKRALA